MKYFTIALVLVILLYGAWYDSQTNGLKSFLYMKDKTHIEKAFLSNVEKTRQILMYHKNGYKWSIDYQKQLPDSLAFFSRSIYQGLAEYWDDEKEYFYAIPKRACEYLEVEVGDISYSRDSLKCVALVTVRNDSPSFTTHKQSGLYDGHAIIGIRSSKDEKFKIYPEKFITFSKFPDKRKVLDLLKLSYYNLKGSYTPNSGVQYSCGVNDPEFFETAFEFSLVKSSGLDLSCNLYLYWCETDMSPGGKRYPYIFYSNLDSTINNYLCDE